MPGIWKPSRSSAFGFYQPAYAALRQKSPGILRLCVYTELSVSHRIPPHSAQTLVRPYVLVVAIW